MPEFPHGLGAEELEGAYALLYERLIDVQRAHGQLVSGVLTALPCAPELVELIESTLYESETSTRRLGALLSRLFCAAGVIDAAGTGRTAAPTS
ncbi:MAG TPA: hypothetical protein VFN74_21415, partial [Chloroflexota bacterium]|nr:hypothetical protein [Chloroflexota bacterium]